MLKIRVLQRLIRFGGLVGIALALALAAPAHAQTTLPPISFGAGMRTSFVHTDPDDGESSDTASSLDSARLYVSGSVTNNIKFMFNTEYNGATNDVGVMDAVARFEFSPSSTSGSAASCRRATARTSTARTTRITGPSTPTASRTATRSSSRAAPTA